MGGVFAAGATILTDLQFFRSISAVSFGDVTEEVANRAFETSKLAGTFLSHMFYSWYCNTM